MPEKTVDTWFINARKRRKKELLSFRDPAEALRAGRIESLAGAQLQLQHQQAQQQLRAAVAASASVKRGLANGSAALFAASTAISPSALAPAPAPAAAAAQHLPRPPRRSGRARSGRGWLACRPCCARF